MGNLVFGSGAEPGHASKARGGLAESSMERDYDATESERERYSITHHAQNVHTTFLCRYQYAERFEEGVGAKTFLVRWSEKKNSYDDNK